MDGAGVTLAERKRSIGLLLPLSAVCGVLACAKSCGFGMLWPPVFGLCISHQLGPLWDATIVICPPCSRLRVWLGFFFSKRTMDRVFDAAIADVQAEWQEACSQGRSGHAIWIQLRGYWHVLNHLGAQSLVSAARAVYEAWKAG